MSRFEDLIRGFDDNFADKLKTNQSLDTLESKIQALLELINALKNTKLPKTEEAFFSKKPLTGNSCASCEKNFQFLNGMPAEF